MSKLARLAAAALVLAFAAAAQAAAAGAPRVVVTLVRWPYT
jgi:ABC-type proline/glycine betaine transport system substrate-binding protein